jgi:hypothetical protein
MVFSSFDHLLQRIEQGSRISTLVSNINVLRIEGPVADYWGVQVKGVSRRESRVGARAPLHGCAESIPVVQPDVITHADFIPIIYNRGARQGE